MSIFIRINILILFAFIEVSQFSANLESGKYLQIDKRISIRFRARNGGKAEYNRP